MPRMLLMYPVCTFCKDTNDDYNTVALIACVESLGCYCLLMFMLSVTECIPCGIYARSECIRTLEYSVCKSGICANYTASPLWQSCQDIAWD